MKILQFPTLLWATGAADPDCQKVLITRLCPWRSPWLGIGAGKLLWGTQLAYTVPLRELKNGALSLQTQPTQGFRLG